MSQIIQVAKDFLSGLINFGKLVLHIPDYISYLFSYIGMVIPSVFIAYILLSITIIVVLKIIGRD